MNELYEVINYNPCNCGATEVELENMNDFKSIKVNFNGSIKEFKQAYYSILHGETSSKPFIEGKYTHCNYCVNKWGLDLCGCGSGETYGECETCEGEYGVSQEISSDFVSTCDTNLGASMFVFR